jgi:hypothetical protein
MVFDSSSCSGHVLIRPVQHDWHQTKTIYLPPPIPRRFLNIKAAIGQTCIVHLLRHSLDYVSWKDRKPVAAAVSVS